MRFTCSDNIFRVIEKQRGLTQLQEAWIYFQEEVALEVRRKDAPGGEISMNKDKVGQRVWCLQTAQTGA